MGRIQAIYIHAGFNRLRCMSDIYFTGMCVVMLPGENVRSNLAKSGVIKLSRTNFRFDMISDGNMI